jgi:hypothetical protein
MVAHALCARGKTAMTKPNRIETNLENFPRALAPLCKIDHWVLWRWEQRKGVWTKPPYMAMDPWRKAKNNDPTTWASYEVAASAAKGADGIGFALLDTPFAAIDLDHCIADGEIDPWAKAWIEAANGAYVEMTPSGEGLRIIGLGTGDKLHRKWKIEGARMGAAIEIYRGCERYITVTVRNLATARSWHLSMCSWKLRRATTPSKMEQGLISTRPTRRSITRRSSVLGHRPMLM